ncbi:MAG: hypothetical protein ACK4U0_09130 [Mesorhizobium sp.]
MTESRRTGEERELLRTEAPPSNPDPRHAAGIPPLESRVRYPWFKRRIPEPVFYVVPALMWLVLSLRHGSLTLPTAANPTMEAGGFFGESKLQGLALFGERALRRLAPYVVVEPRAPTGCEQARCSDAMSLLAGAGLDFPVVAKPDVGYQGWGVRRIDDAAGLLAYLTTCAPDLRLILQRHVGLAGEAGVFYVREPGEPAGRIASMAFVYAPHVTGDGVRTVEALVKADDVLGKSIAIHAPRNQDRWRLVPEQGETVALVGPRSARLGAVYRDASASITPALEAEIDAIARDIDGLHFGRFDLKFGSVAGLERGEDFEILELNGAGAEMLDIWDGRVGLMAAYRTLWRQYRKLFAIGAAQRQRGVRPAGLRKVVGMVARQERMRCRYPVSG